LVDSVATVDIGGTPTGGEPTLMSASAAVRMPNGIAIADPSDFSVKLFDLKGKLIKKLGREGSGPGEFRGLNWLGRCNSDSLLIWDSKLYRVSVADAAGRFVRQYRMPVFVNRLRCSEQGSVAALMMPKQSYRPQDMGKVPPFTADLALYNTTGEVIAKVGEVPIGEYRPAGRLTQIAVGDTRVYVGTGESAYVDIYGLDGVHRGSTPVGVARRSLTRDRYERAVDRMLKGMYKNTPKVAASVRQQLLAVPMPDYLPIYGSVFGATNNVLWVVTSATGDSTTQVRGIDGNGNILGDIVFPAETLILDAQNDHILIGYETGEGEQHVAMYRVHIDPSRLTAARGNPTGKAN
jgi:hypothetical protein